MAFPQVASITPTTFGTNTTQHLVAMPATVNVDDLLISIFNNDNGASTVTIPTGWTQVSQNNTGGSRFSIFKKKADGSEGGTTVDHVTSTVEAATAQVYRITAWSGVLADVVSGTAAVGTSTLPNPPSLTPAAGAQDYLWLALCGYDADGTISVYPTNYTNGTNTVGASAAASTGSARRELNATVDDPDTFTMSASVVWGAQTIAVPPATGSSSTGTVAVTQDAQTSTVSGTHTNPPATGTATPTQADHTSTITGTFTGAGGGGGLRNRLLLGVG